MPNDPIQIQNLLAALEARGLSAATREQIALAARRWGVGGWQRIAPYRMPTGRTLAEHWRAIAPSTRRLPRPHEYVRQLARGRPHEMIEEQAEYPALLADLVQLLDAVVRGR